MTDFADSSHDGWDDCPDLIVFPIPGAGFFVPRFDLIQEYDSNADQFGKLDVCGLIGI